MAEGTSTRQQEVDESLNFTDQTVATISIGYAGQPIRQFKIQNSLLCAHSDAFREFFEIQNCMGVDTFAMIEPSDVPPRAFDVFVKWLHTKELIVEDMEVNGIANGVGTNSEAEASWHEDLRPVPRRLARLLDLYCLAETYKITIFKTTVMLAFQRVATDQIPPVIVVNRFLEKSDMHSSAMCRFLAVCYGAATHNLMTDAQTQMWVNELASLPRRFLARVVLVQGQRTSVGAVKRRFENWCEYHGHKSDEERKNCEEGRPNDADLRHKKQNAEGADGLSVAAVDSVGPSPSQPPDQL